MAFRRSNTARPLGVSWAITGLFEGSGVLEWKRGGEGEAVVHAASTSKSILKLSGCSLVCWFPLGTPHFVMPVIFFGVHWFSHSIEFAP